MNELSLPSRRGFLVSCTGLALVGGFGPITRAAAQAAPASAFAPNIWFSMAPDLTTTVFIAKAEMGQHVGTPLAQALAEELEIPWEHVRIVHVDSDPKWGLMVTGGSWSVNWTFDTMSRAGAAGRLALIAAAAKTWNVPAASCSAADGVVRHPSGKTLSYGDIIVRGKVAATVDEAGWKTLPLKKPSEYKIVGKKIAALDIPSKTNGTAIYGIDANLPGMVYGAPVIPPTRTGSTVTAVDDRAARTVPGFIKAVVLDDPSDTFPGWVVAVAETYPAAVRAASALQVEYKKGPTAGVSTETIFDAARKLHGDAAAGVFWVKDGDAASHLGPSVDVISAAYTTDPVLHTTMEPANAAAVEQDGVWHLHGGNQWQSVAVPLAAKALGVDPAKVVIHQYFLGGGFGRRLYGDYLIPAALTAKALGRPVKVVYTRENDMRFDCARAPSYQPMQATLGTDGKILALTHDVIAGWPSYLVAPAFLADTPDKKGKADSFAVSGADFWYTVPHHSVRAIRNELSQQALPPGYLRSVGPGFTTFAVESFMDELAERAKQDPLAFRLKHLDGVGKQAGAAPNSAGGAKRLAAVLKEVAARGDYGQTGLPAGTAQGLAASFGQERGMPTFTGCVALVAVDRKTGAVTVKKLTLVCDVGIPVNPDGVRAQMESAALWGMSVALFEQASVKNGAIEQSNFYDYTPLRMSQVPELNISFMPSTEYPVGVGEPPMTAVAPAIANAIRKAVGARVRGLPMTPARVLAAISA
jgi:isoquinoline 1-oxidoreductase beta subunit